MKQQMDRELGQACIEAFRKARHGKSSVPSKAQLSEVSLKEPRNQTFGQRASESAANGSTINLQENQTVNNQGTSIYTQEFLERQRVFEQEQERIATRMKEAFMDMGFSEAQAAQAARPKERVTLEPQVQDFVGYEAQASNMRESTRQMEQWLSKFNPEEQQAKSVEAFKDLGFSEGAAKQAAHGHLREARY